MNSDKEIADVARAYVKACAHFHKLASQVGEDEYDRLYVECDKLYDILEHLVEKEGK